MHLKSVADSKMQNLFVWGNIDWQTFLMTNIYTVLDFTKMNVF